MKYSNLAVLLIFTMLSITLVSSAPPFLEENIGTLNGLQIFAPQYTAVKYNTTFNPHIHVSNISNGILLSNNLVDCTLHLYGKDGNHLFESGVLEKNSNGIDHEIELLYGNFTQHGEINAYSINCNMSNLGGDVKGIYEITANGKPSPEGLIIFGFIIILLFIFMFMIVFLIRAVGLMIEASFDILDIAYAWGLFFGLLGVNLFAGIYLGNVTINNFLDLLIKILAFPFVIVPVVAFFLSLFRTKKKQKEKEAEW